MVHFHVNNGYTEDKTRGKREVTLQTVNVTSGSQEKNLNNKFYTICEIAKIENGLPAIETVESFTQVS